MLPAVWDRIRAAVCRDFGSVCVEAVELRRPGVGEVGVRVSACAVCHSDLTLLRGDWGGDLPAIYGHEVAGVVEEVGAGVVGLQPGDHVVVTLIRSCGRCRQCLDGRPALCERRDELPLTLDPPLRDADGRRVEQGLRTAGFAERVTVHASQVVPIPSAVPLASAALLGCGVLTGVGAVLTTAGVEAGETLGVLGAGGVGLNSVQGGVLAGASLVVAVDPQPGKRAAALALGATHALDPGDGLVERIAELTGGRGLDHVVVTAAATAAVTQALALVAAGGAVTLVGMPPGATVAIEPETIAERGLRILGSKVGGARPHLDVPRLADLYLQQRLILDELISARCGLDDVGQALATAAAGEALRVVLVP
jgi:S-(hydroxymethyl)glutathione dehydrogenase / alcohol dehydrogenase